MATKPTGPRMLGKTGRTALETLEKRSTLNVKENVYYVTYTIGLATGRFAEGSEVIHANITESTGEHVMTLMGTTVGDIETQIDILIEPN